MQPFIASFRFATSPILHDSCTLDAVLGGELARGINELAHAIAQTPLKTTQGIPHGSSLLLLENTHATREISCVQKSTAAFYEIDPAQISAGNKRVDKPWRAVIQSAFNQYQTQVCGGGAWLGVGDMAAVQALLQPLLGVGKRRGAGWGMLQANSLEVEAVDANPQTWGLVATPEDPEGFDTEIITPRRPLPVQLFESLGGDPTRHLLAMKRVRQPYYAANNPPESAVLPLENPVLP